MSSPKRRRASRRRVSAGDARLEIGAARGAASSRCHPTPDSVAKRFGLWLADGGSRRIQGDNAATSSLSRNGLPMKPMTGRADRSRSARIRDMGSGKHRHRRLSAEEHSPSSAGGGTVGTGRRAGHHRKRSGIRLRRRSSRSDRPAFFLGYGPQASCGALLARLARGSSERLHSEIAFRFTARIVMSIR